MDYNITRRTLGPEPRIGFDIGRVLIHPGDGRHDTSFLSGSDEDAMQTPPMEGAFDVVREITELTDRRTWLLSKCGANIQRRSLRWLRYHRFYELTGLRPDRVVFCRKRPEKAPHCERLGLVAFVDDRPDIHRHLEGIVPLRILYGPQKSGTCPPAGVTPAANWAEVRSILVPLLRPETRDTGAARQL